jgi:hypothetical protein
MVKSMCVVGDVSSVNRYRFCEREGEKDCFHDIGIDDDVLC